jgi:hypothetical protein
VAVHHLDDRPLGQRHASTSSDRMLCENRRQARSPHARQRGVQPRRGRRRARCLRAQCAGAGLSRVVVQDADLVPDAWSAGMSVAR